MFPGLRRVKNINAEKDRTGEGKLNADSWSLLFTDLVALKKAVFFFYLLFYFYLNVSGKSASEVSIRIQQQSEAVSLR